MQHFSMKAICAALFKEKLKGKKKAEYIKCIKIEEMDGKKHISVLYTGYW